MIDVSKMFVEFEFSCKSRTTKHLVVWKDSGPHYRNYGVVGSVGMHVIDKYTLDSSAIIFGPAAHWEGISDARFSQNNAALSQDVVEHNVINVDDYIKVLQDRFATLIALPKRPNDG